MEGEDGEDGRSLVSLVDGWRGSLLRRRAQLFFFFLLPSLELMSEIVNWKNYTLLVKFLSLFSLQLPVYFIGALLNHSPIG